MSYNQIVRLVVFTIFCSVFSFVSFTQIRPVKNPSVILFKNIKPYSFEVHYDKVKDAENYLVLISEKGIPLTNPIDNISYLKGDGLYDSKVAYVGKDTFFIPKGIRANHSYNYVVFAFNGKPGAEKYQIQNPPYNVIKTKGLNIGHYYEEIIATAPNFTSQLYDLISKHTVIPYYNYKTTLIEDVELIDTTKGMRYVECVYTGDKKLFSGPFDWTQQGYSREHTFPHSWMPTYPANNPEKPEYSDFHNLYPTNLDKANSIRSNYPFGEINGKIHYEYKDGKLGEMDGVLVYEPSNKQKGNIARAIFYMLTAYNSIDVNWALPSKQNENLLKKWHYQDLPDDYEITRQEYIFDKQGNRNPFIDSIDFVCKIDFYTMMKSKKCLLNIEQINPNELFTVLHDVEKNNFVVQSKELLDLEIISTNGILIQRIPINQNIPFFDNGIYFLKVSYKNQSFIRKIIF